MAAPNVVTTTSIICKTAGQSVLDTATNFVINSSSSNKVFKINTLIIANIDASTAYAITADVYKNQSTSYKFASGIVVPATTSIVLISKDSGIYLEENDSIRLSTSATSKLQAICSYEEIM